jgi:hypothetical protein
MRRRVLLIALLPTVGLLLGLGAGAVLGDATTTGVPGVDQVPVLAAGGTVGLITGMAILILLFLTGRVERGAVAAEWKAVAQESAKATTVLVPSIEKLINITERLLKGVEDQNTEARLRREFEQERAGKPRSGTWPTHDEEHT